MGSTADSGDLLATRYGRTPGSSRRRTVVAAGVGVAVLIVVAVWVIWVGLFGPGASFEARDVGHVIEADGSVEVRFDITTEPGTAVSCALQALNEQFAIVGWKVIEIPPGEARTRTFEQIVRTTETPTTGLIYRCWLT